MPMSLSCLLLLTLSMLSNCFAARSGPLRAYEFYTNFVDIDCRTTEDPLMGWLHVLPTVIRFDLSLDEEENFVLEAYESEKEEVGSKDRRDDLYFQYQQEHREDVIMPDVFKIVLPIRLWLSVLPGTYTGLSTWQMPDSVCCRVGAQWHIAIDPINDEVLFDSAVAGRSCRDRPSTQHGPIDGFTICPFSYDVPPAHPEWQSCTLSGKLGWRSYDLQPRE